MKRPQVYKHVIQVTLLTIDYQLPDDIDLAEMQHRIDSGKDIGDYTIKPAIPIDGLDLENELKAMGNDGKFFDHIDEDEKAVIPAEVHSDDHAIEVTFNALHWFEQASDEEIQGLIDCDFGGDYPADAVSDWTRDYDPEVAKMYEYIEARHPIDGIGFECQVARGDAEEWIRDNRPHLRLKE